MVSDMIYNKKFYDGQKAGSNSSAEVIVPIVLEALIDKPDSIVDFGCGTGSFLSVFKRILPKTYIMGLDFGDVSGNLQIKEDEFIHMDLSSKCELTKKFDLCVSLEVAEHIEAEYADVFCDNLCNASDMILFSAALPKQGGTGHVNEQNITYWAEKFEKRGYKQCDFIRKQIWNHSDVAYWYKQNIAMYVKNDTLDKISFEEKDSFDGMPICHPDALFSSVSFYEGKIVNWDWFKRHIHH